MLGEVDILRGTGATTGFLSQAQRLWPDKVYTTATDGGATTSAVYADRRLHDALVDLRKHAVDTPEVIAGAALYTQSSISTMDPAAVVSWLCGTDRTAEVQADIIGRAREIFDAEPAVYPLLLVLTERPYDPTHRSIFGSIRVTLSGPNRSYVDAPPDCCYPCGYLLAGERWPPTVRVRVVGVENNGVPASTLAIPDGGLIDAEGTYFSRAATSRILKMDTENGVYKYDDVKRSKLDLRTVLRKQEIVEGIFRGVAFIEQEGGKRMYPDGPPVLDHELGA